MDKFGLFEPEEQVGATEGKVQWFEPSRELYTSWDEYRKRKAREVKRGKDGYLLSAKKKFGGGKPWPPSKVKSLLDKFERALVANVRDAARKKTKSEYKTYLDGAVGLSAEENWQDHVVSSLSEAKLERESKEAEKAVRIAQAKKILLQERALSVVGQRPGEAKLAGDEGEDDREAAIQARNERAARRANRNEDDRLEELERAREELDQATSRLAEAQEKLRSYRWKTVLTLCGRYNIQWILADDLVAQVLHEKGFRRATGLPEMTWNEVRAVIMRSFKTQEDHIELLEDLLSARRSEVLTAWLAKVQSLSARVMDCLQLKETAQTKQLWVDLAWRQVTEPEISRIFGDKKLSEVGAMIEACQQKVEDGAAIPRFDPKRIRKRTARLLVRPSTPSIAEKLVPKADEKDPGSRKSNSSRSKKRKEGRGPKDQDEPKKERAKGGKRRTPLSKITCFHCQRKGHYAADCPDKDKPAVPRKPGERSQVPRKAVPPPAKTDRRTKDQYPVEEEPEAEADEVIINFDARRDSDSSVAVHAVGCSWVQQTREMGYGGGYARYCVEDLAKQQRGDLYAPKCCRKALTAAGHVESLEMMTAEAVHFSWGARR